MEPTATQIGRISDVVQVGRGDEHLSLASQTQHPRYDSRGARNALGVDPPCWGSSSNAAACGLAHSLRLGSPTSLLAPFRSSLAETRTPPSPSPRISRRLPRHALRRR